MHYFQGLCTSCSHFSKALRWGWAADFVTAVSQRAQLQNSEQLTTEQGQCRRADIQQNQPRHSLASASPTYKTASCCQCPITFPMGVFNQSQETVLCSANRWERKCSLQRVRCWQAPCCQCSNLYHCIRPCFQNSVYLCDVLCCCLLFQQTDATPCWFWTLDFICVHLFARITALCGLHVVRLLQY